jgi:hypothetical protein
MRTVIVAVTAALVACGDANALAPWTTADTVFETAVAASVALDLAQTSALLHRGGMHETNPILGRRPSDGSLMLYGGACAVLHAGIARLLPYPYRRVWQVAWVGIEAVQIRDNWQASGRLEFRLPF